MPVLIYEQVKTAEYLRLFKRYKNNLLFVGSMNVLGLLLLGLTGYTYLMGARARSYVATSVHNGLLTVLANARIDDSMYRVLEWFQKNNRLVIYVTKEFRQ
jgi:hypothetical protein